MISNEGLPGEASCKEPWALGKRSGVVRHTLTQKVNPLSSMSSEHLFFE